MARLRCAALAIFAALSFLRLASAEIRYQIVNLSPIFLYDDDQSFQTFGTLSINNVGQIAARFNLYTPGFGLTPLPIDARGLNDAGEVIGSAGPPVAHLWKPGPTLGDPGTDIVIGPGQALGINNAGAVVGFAGDPVEQRRGWHRSAAGALTPLSFNALERWGGASAINDSGLIAGADGYYNVGYLWSSPADVGQSLPYPDGLGSAEDINNAGHVVGRGHSANVVLYKPGVGFQNLGQLNATESWPNAINESGQVVGITSFDLDDDLGTAWIYNSGEGIVNLNSLVAPQGPGGWLLRNAQSINDQGQIVGLGRLGGNEYIPFLLNPIPEPATALMVLSFAVLPRRRRRGTRLAQTVAAPICRGLRPASISPGRQLSFGSHQ